MSFQQKIHSNELDQTGNNLEELDIATHTSWRGEYDEIVCFDPQGKVKTDSISLFVGDLSRVVIPDDLFQLFSQCGKV